MILNDFFDKVFVINLDHRIDRWEKVVDRFKSINLNDYERFSAIKSQEGWEGCKLSHLSIIKIAKERGYKNFIVFEDDFLLHDNFENLLKDTLSQLPNNWDMFYLGGNTSYSKYKELISPNIIKLDSVLTTHCYAMKETLYDRVLNEANKMSPQRDFFRGQAIDVYYSQFICKDSNVYIAEPMLCYQEEGYSDIEKKIMNYKNMIK